MQPISIVIRTFNCAAVLQATLRELRLRPADQLIVVDSGSSDDTVKVAQQHGAELLRIPAAEFTYGRSLNLGFDAARHEWILALSSHSVPSTPEFLSIYDSAISGFPADVAAAVGPIVLTKDARLQGGITFLRRADFRHGFPFPSGNPNAIYRRSLWQEHKFDEALPGAEECEWFVWAVKKDYQLAAVHRAAVRYESRRSLRSFYKKGQVDYRWQSQYLDVGAPSASRLGWYFLKQCAMAAAGRLPAHLPLRNAAHALGQLAERRKLARSGQVPKPAILLD
ncbi:MAG TPA: glycosyltransferase [Methylomirabilota bacterium]|nr:glycosyltransferase [Methylomirabilota bacterium]